MTEPDPDDFTQLLELEALDDPGFTQIGHWVSFCRELSPTSRKLYDLLAAFVNQKRRKAGDTDVWPSLELLATSLCLSKGELVTPYMDELLQIGAIAKRTRTIGGMQARNVYGVRFNPPPGWTGPVSLDEIMTDAKAIASSPDKMRAAAKEAKALISERRDTEKAVRAQERKASTKPKTPAQEAPRKTGVPEQGQTEPAGEHVPRKTGVRPPKNRGASPEKPGCNNTEGQTTRRASSSSGETSGTPAPQGPVEEDEEQPAAPKTRQGRPVDLVLEHTDATNDEAQALVDLLRPEAKRSLGGFVRTLASRGDLDHRLWLLRRQSAPEPRTGGPAAPSRPRTMCVLHGGQGPCPACRDDLTDGGALAQAVTDMYQGLGPERADLRPDLAQHPALAAV